MSKFNPFERSGGPQRSQQQFEQAVGKTLDQVSSVDYLNGSLLTDVSVSTTATQIAHKLGREPRGWWPVRWQGAFPTTSVSTSNPGYNGPELVRWYSVKVNATGSPAAPAITLPWTPTDGNRLVFCHAGQAPGTANGIASITQSGATWTELDKDERSAAGCRVYLWYSDEVSSFGTGMTITAGGTSNVKGVFHVIEFANVSTDSNPFVNSANTGGNSVVSGTSEMGTLGYLDPSGDDHFIIGTICEDRPPAQCIVDVHGAGLRTLNTSDGAGATGSFATNGCVLFGGRQMSREISRDDTPQDIFWVPSVTGGTTLGYAFVWGALKAGSSGGSSNVTVPHGLRETARDDKFLTLVASGSATVDLWVW